MKTFKIIILSLILLITLLMSGFSLYLHFYGGVFKYQYLNRIKPLSIDEFYNIGPIFQEDDYYYKLHGYLVKVEPNRLYLVSELKPVNLSNQFQYWNRLQIRYPIEKIHDNCINTQVEISAKYFSISGLPNLDEVTSIFNMEDSSYCVKRPVLLAYNHFCHTRLKDKTVNPSLEKFCKDRDSEQILMKTTKNNEN